MNSIIIKSLLYAVVFLSSVGMAAPVKLKIDCKQRDLTLAVRTNMSVPQALWTGEISKNDFLSKEDSFTRPLFENLVIDFYQEVTAPVTELSTLGDVRDLSGDISKLITEISDPEADYYYSSTLILKSIFEFRGDRVFLSTNFSPYIFVINDGFEEWYPMNCQIEML